MSKIHVLDFAKPYESMDDYNFLQWGTIFSLSQDITKKLIPDYKTREDEAVDYAMKAASLVIQELLQANKIVFTDRERKELEIGKKINRQRKQEIIDLTNEYGSEKIARVIQANVYNAFRNSGKKKTTYETAKAWCIEHGVFEDIEYRAVNLLPSRKSAHEEVPGNGNIKK